MKAKILEEDMQDEDNENQHDPNEVDIDREMGTPNAPLPPTSIVLDKGMRKRKALTNNNDHKNVNEMSQMTKNGLEKGRKRKESQDSKTKIKKRFADAFRKAVKNRLVAQQEPLTFIEVCADGSKTRIGMRRDQVLEWARSRVPTTKEEEDGKYKIFSQSSDAKKEIVMVQVINQ